MKTTKIGGRFFYSILVLVIWTMNLFADPAYPVFSNNELLKMGYENYNRNNYAYSAIYLYAYIQRNPPLINEPNFAKQVREALTYSLRRGSVADVKGDYIGNNSLNISKPVFNKPPQPASFFIEHVKKYLMDKQPGRVIIVTHIQNNKYCIEEPGSSWPWAGIVTIEGHLLSGEARARNSLASMKIQGTVRSDGSIGVEYKFITGNNGRPAAGRIDNHIWYPAN